MNRVQSSWVAIVCVAIASAGCIDPYLDNLIDELGEEESGFAPSEIHRPGQPCLACHSEYVGEEPQMSFGGTIFAEPLGQDLILLEGFTVRLLDSEGQIVNIETNKCGNFYTTVEQFDPAYPVRAELWGPSTPNGDDLVQLRPMASRIAREGSCGGCHIHPASGYSPGVAFVPSAFLAPDLTPPTGCPTPRFADPL